MIDLPIYNMAGKQVDSLAIDEARLGGEVRPALLKQAYVMFHANQRQGSARTKNRSRVEGSTRKLYKQKGTGNARMGTVRTNLRKGGGVTFAKLRTRDDYRMEMPRKMRQLANRNALLAKLVDSEIKCFDALAFKQPRTKDFRAALDSVGVNRTCLVALGGDNRNAALSARNLVGCTTIRADQINVFHLLNHRFVVIERDALQAFVDGTIWEMEKANGEVGEEAAAVKPKSTSRAGASTAGSQKKTRTKKVAAS